MSEIGNGAVLLETVATASRGEPVYYQCYTDLGPACTRDFRDAMVFKSQDAARLDRAYGFSLTNFEPYEADELAIWDALTRPEEGSSRWETVETG